VVLIEPLEADFQSHESDRKYEHSQKENHHSKVRDSHPEAATEIMKRALKAGKARRAVPLKTVAMRLPAPDIQTTQDLAHEKGLPYQTYIKMLLHEALKKERSA
jgi:predicted DNA binding CopG/RHH family protein